MLRIIINGVERELDAAPDTPLLWVLRDALGLKGAKFGCGIGICGICTVLADDEPVRSCVVPLSEVVDRHITTIEGLSQRGHPVLWSWIREQVPQCGYCQPGQILAALALLRRQPDPDDATIDEALSGILCRCGTYQRIRRAIHGTARSASNPSQTIVPVTGISDKGVALNQWLRITQDGTVIVTINHSEMGQGVTTALSMLVAEELEADPDKVRTEFAPAAPRYRNPRFGVQTTGGSTSVRGEWERLSRAGAEARIRLIEAAAQRWGVGQKDCAAEHGAVIHQPSGRRFGYGELAQDATLIRPPDRVPLKPADQWRLLGRPLPRLDIPDMVTGRTVYGLDVSLPGMRVASVVRCPVIGGKPKSFDASAALAIPGIERVLEISGGVAVVGRDTWAVLQGREVLQVRWDVGPHAGFNTAALHAQLTVALERSGNQRQRTGHVSRAMKQAARIVEAEYSTAPLAHATLEPMNCTARVTNERCDVWVGTQSQEDAKKTAAKVSGLSRARVRVHSQFLGGGFGRRLETDMVAEAVELAKNIGSPVQVVWTRADDIQHDHYRPAYRARLRAALDVNGWPTAWFQRSAGPGVAGEACAELGYAIPSVHTEFVEVESPLPAGAWRSVGAGQDAFAVESFIDELALAARRDPLAYRQSLLRDSPRHGVVLEMAATAAGWGRPAAGRHQGVAVYRSFGSYVAQIAEVAVTNATVHVHRVVSVIDCGRKVNPDIIRAQVEGGVAFGLSAALKESITVEQGQVTQKNFEDYPILTLAEMPRVEVHIVESGEAPGGVGEPGVPPIAPAVANAVAAATGTRLRSLPLRLAD